MDIYECAAQHFFGSQSTGRLPLLSSLTTWIHPSDGAPTDPRTSINRHRKEEVTTSATGTTSSRHPRCRCSLSSQSVVVAQSTTCWTYALWLDCCLILSHCRRRKNHEANAPATEARERGGVVGDLLLPAHAAPLRTIDERPGGIGPFLPNLKRPNGSGLSGKQFARTLLG